MFTLLLKRITLLFSIALHDSLLYNSLHKAVDNGCLVGDSI